jgi:hypothetical protein
MLATDIITRAIGQIDLINTQFITYNDKYNSLNESYKDIYNQMIQSNNDFYLKEVQLTITSAMIGTGPYEYKVPLPSDFFQIRYADYNGPQGWSVMKKWNYEVKDDLLVEPEYRIANNNLWVIVGSPSAATTNLTIRVGYYPPPSTITLPDNNYQFGLSYSSANFNSISQPCYAYWSTTTPYDAMFYVYNGTNIVVEIMETGSVPLTLYTSANTVTNLFWYKGYLYWQSNGAILKAAVDLTAPAVIVAPTTLVGPGGISNLEDVMNNLIYFSAGTNTYSMTTAGASSTIVLNIPTQCAQYTTSGLYWIGLGDTLCAQTSTGPIVLSTTAVDINWDGTYLYVLDTSNNLWSYKPIAFGDTIATSANGTIIQTDVSNPLGPINNGRTAVLLQEGAKLLSISNPINFDFGAMNNIVPEIMSLRAAIDFGIKQGRDITQQQTRLQEFWARFRNMVKRDEYKYERVQNYYKAFQSGIYSFYDFDYIYRNSKYFKIEIFEIWKPEDY